METLKASGATYTISCHHRELHLETIPLDTNLRDLLLLNHILSLIKIELKESDEHFSYLYLKFKHVAETERKEGEKIMFFVMKNFPPRGQQHSAHFFTSAPLAHHSVM